MYYAWHLERRDIRGLASPESDINILLTVPLARAEPAGQ